jgi:hypothetical protein
MTDAQIGYGFNERKKSGSEIPDTASPAFEGFEILLMLQYKSHNEIHNDRGTDGKKRKINKIHTDPCGIDTQFFSPPGAYTECP